MTGVGTKMCKNVLFRWPIETSRFHADSRKNYTRLFKAAFYLGSISAVFSSPVFDPAGSFSRTAAG